MLKSSCGLIVYPRCEIARSQQRVNRVPTSRRIGELVINCGLFRGLWSLGRVAEFAPFELVLLCGGWRCAGVLAAGCVRAGGGGWLRGLCGLE